MRRPLRQANLVPHSESMGLDKKDEIIEKLREEKRQRDEELEKLKKMVNEKQGVNESKKEKSRDKMSISNAPKSSPHEEAESIQSMTKPNKKSFNKESSLDPLGDDNPTNNENPNNEQEISKKDPSMSPDNDILNNAHDISKPSMVSSGPVNVLAALKEEEMKKLQEANEKAKKEIEDAKLEKEKALAELKANQEKAMQEMEAKLFAKLQAQQEAEKKRLKEEMENAAKLEKEKLQSELLEAKKKLESQKQSESKESLGDSFNGKQAPSTKQASQPKPIVQPEPATIPNPKPVISEPKPPPAPAKTIQNPAAKPPLPKKGQNSEDEKNPLETSKKENNNEMSQSKGNLSKDQAKDLSESKKEDEDSVRPEGPEEHLYAKILYNPDHTYKLTVHGKQDPGQKVEIHVSMKCIDTPTHKIKDEILDDTNIQQVLESTSLRDVAPYSILAKGLCNLTSMMKYGVVPFAQIGQEPDDKNIEIWVHAGGILKDNGLQVNFLGSACHMGLHHVEGERMRISLTIIDSEVGGTIYIDLDYDKISFTKEFTRTDITKYKEDPKEEWCNCFEPVPIEFLNHVDAALNEIESHLRRTHRGKFSCEDVARDPTLRFILVTIRAPNARQTLWVMREFEKEQKFEIYSKTLYEVALSETNKVPITRTLNYTYDTLWSEFGVEFRSLPIGSQQYFLFEVLKRCNLYIPKEIEESTANEDIQIQMAPLIDVNYYRTIVGNKYKFPLTLTLLGCESNILGVKAVVYNPEKMKEVGVFFIVNQEQWGFSEEEKNAVPKRKDYQKDALLDYSYLPGKLKKKGYKKIMSTIKIEYNQKGEPSITYNGKNGPAFVDYLENIFWHVKKEK